MAIDFTALSVIHPGLAAAVPQFLPDTATVYRREVTPVATTNAADFGYEPEPGDPAPAGPVLVGTFPCQYGENRQQDGKQTVVVNGVETILPALVQFYVEDAQNVEVGDEIHVAGLVLKVVVPPRAGSFDVLAGALCQETIPKP